jgi:hypothetical protein
MNNLTKASAYLTVAAGSLWSLSISDTKIVEPSDVRDY